MALDLRPGTHRLRGVAGIGATVVVLALLASGSEAAQPAPSGHQVKSAVAPPAERADSVPVAAGTRPPKVPRLDSSPLASAEEAASSAVADRIRRLVAQGHLTGNFAGVDGTTNPAELVLFWHGEVPAVLAAMLADLRISAPAVHVVVTPADYTLTTLDREARRIIDIPESELGALVTQAGPRPDYSGVVVYTDRPLSAAGRQKIAGTIPLDFGVRQQAIPADAPAGAVPAGVPPASRWSDVEPYYGGGLITRPAGAGLFELCTAGFSAHSAGGIKYMITSRHCGTTSPWYTGDEFTGGPAIVVGNVKNSNVTLDTMALGDRSYRGYVYNGAYTTTYAEQVSGANNIGRSRAVFPSGALSGTWGVTVESVSQYINLEGVGRVGPGMWMVDSLGRASVGQGDSGGPVYTGEANGTAGARGIITAVDSSQAGPCLGYNFARRLCSKRSFATQINEVLAYYRLTIDVG